MKTYQVTEIAVYEWKARSEKEALSKHLNATSVERDKHLLKVTEREVGKA